MAQRSTAVVKWFNNKAGYGFLTFVGDDQTTEDIFVHHTEIQVGKDQYKYLVQGEYVEFTLSQDAGQHKCLATAVRGVNGGRLMCETRSDRPAREFTPTTETSSPRSYAGRGRGGGRGGSSSHGRTGTHGRTTPSSQPPTLPADAQGEWMVVKRTKPATRRPLSELSS
jgi:cold shock CspA family protein